MPPEMAQCNIDVASEDAYLSTISANMPLIAMD